MIKNVLVIMVSLMIQYFPSTSLASNITYAYDNLNRITKVDYGNGTVENYTYDNSGNRLTRNIVDMTPPTGSIRVNNNAPYTASNSVLLSLFATDNSGSVASMQFSQDNITWSGWVGYATASNATLPGDDGIKYYYVRFKDASNNVSSIYSSTINLDTTPPTTSAFPADGVYSASQNVTLTSNETATTYYTTNGNAPTSSSAKYSGPITISTTTTLKFYSVDMLGHTEAVKTQAYKILTNPQTLSINLVGTGGGSVNSSESSFACAASSCSQIFELGTIVNLFAAPNSVSTFTGWSGICSGTGTCNVTMNSPQAITATFTKAPKAKIGAIGYDSLSTAYAGAASTATILALDSDMTDSGLILSQRKTIKIKGGYRADYSGRSGLTTLLNGPLSIRNGKLVVDRLTLK